MTSARSFRPHRRRTRARFPGGFFKPAAGAARRSAEPVLSLSDGGARAGGSGGVQRMGLPPDSSAGFASESGAFLRRDPFAGFRRRGHGRGHAFFRQQRPFGAEHAWRRPRVLDGGPYFFGRRPALGFFLQRTFRF